ncbi:MAG: hypothetical protein RM338_29190 [Nostoc sp. DedQUE12a]|nr:hypothetical protein [Nostoc sp. DedQUE12a]
MKEQGAGRKEVILILSPTSAPPLEPLMPNELPQVGKAAQRTGSPMPHFLKNLLSHLPDTTRGSQA